MIKANRRTGYADRTRKYKVIIDDKLVGILKAGETKVFELLKGKLKLYLIKSHYKKELFGYK